MSDPRHILGAAGERLAAALLESKGYRILERNLRSAHGELDIVARAPDGVLVFVEVRTRHASDPTPAFESIDRHKRQRLLQLAEADRAEREPEGTARIDVIAVTVDNDGRLRSIDHLENAVES